ncbi:MAG: hypothetical protein ACKV2V_20380 [Blastocatellia bacterium]
MPGSHGKNVFPEDLEAHDQRSPWVSEIGVLGVRDEAIPFARAEKLLAVVVPDFDYLKARGVTNATEWIHRELDNLGGALPEYQRVRDYHIRGEPLPPPGRRGRVIHAVSTSPPPIMPCSTRRRAVHAT